MRISDWSSDVCSSDLSAGTAGGATRGGRPVKPAPFDYYAPATVDEVCQLLTDAGGGATLLAGGQTLMPLLALRMSQPFVLVDLNRIKGLSGVKIGRAHV